MLSTLLLLPMLSTLPLLPMLSMEAKLPTLSNDAALATLSMLAHERIDHRLRELRRSFILGVMKDAGAIHAPRDRIMHFTLLLRFVSNRTRESSVWTRCNRQNDARIDI